MTGVDLGGRRLSKKIKHFISLGEHADVDFGDLLDWLASDVRTRSILLYIESIRAPRKFRSVEGRSIPTQSHFERHRYRYRCHDGAN